MVHPQTRNLTVHLACLMLLFVACAGCRISATDALDSVMLPPGCPICGQVDPCTCGPDSTFAGFRETRWRRLPEPPPGGEVRVMLPDEPLWEETEPLVVPERVNTPSLPQASEPPATGDLPPAPPD